MTLAEAAQMAIKHLGLIDRPCRVDEYGDGLDHFRVFIDCGFFKPTVVITSGKVVRVVGDPPPPDTISIADYRTKLEQHLPKLKEAFAKTDILQAAHAIEELVSSSHPAVGAICVGVVERWETRDMIHCCFRRSAAARKGYERASGKKSSPATMEEKLANRERSGKRVAERDAMISEIAREIGSRNLFELITAMAGFRIGVKKGYSKLERAISAAKILVRSGRPYLTDNPNDPSPHSVYSAHANDDVKTLKKEEYRQLRDDYETWSRVCEREIAAAEELLRSRQTVTA